MVHQTTLQLDLEKLDTYAPPMVSLWPEEHDNQYANSTGALNIDETVPRYVEDGVYTTFYLEIFNTGLIQINSELMSSKTRMQICDFGITIQASVSRKTKVMERSTPQVWIATQRKQFGSKSNPQLPEMTLTRV